MASFYGRYSHWRRSDYVTSGTGQRSHLGQSILASLAVLLTGCTSGLSIGDGSVTEAPSDPPAAASEPSDVRPESTGLPITVTRVSDGDSVRATSSEGDLEIRLIGINAPEQDECFGSDAKTMLEALLDADVVSLHPWPAEIDDFGRELGFLVADDVFVNLRLIELGGVVARAQGDHDFADDFEVAERAASSSRVGLWAPDACGEPTDASVEIVDVLADAPGNDQENPNGEWVMIQNTGSEPADLSGWSIRDESTRHRYDFPTFTLEPGQQARIRTGCGQDDFGSDPAELFWCDPEPPVWNNSGDTAFLLDSNGAIADNQVTE